MTIRDVSKPLVDYTVKLEGKVEELQARVKELEAENTQLRVKAARWEQSARDAWAVQGIE